MPEKPLTELHRNLRELYDKGNAALQKKNYDYAIAIYNQVLQGEPGFYACREALRAAQFAKCGPGGGFFKKVFGTASSSPLIAKAQIQIRSNPQDAMATCEQVLNNDPGNSGANKLLAEAAMALDFPKTAVLSLEICYKNSPKDTDIAMRLGEALGAAGQITRAEKVYSDVKRANPHDPNIDQALKNIAAKRTLKEGGYENIASGSGSYRDILKNKGEAVSLEQENRTVKSEDVAQKLIDEYTARLEQEPDNRRLLRNIADLHVQRKDFDKALEVYQRISSVEGGSDPSLEKAISDTHIRKIEHEISLLDPNSPEFSEKKAALDQQRNEARIAEAKRRVEKYPNDLQFRFELGKLYFETGRISDAIPELQKAQVNPNRRIPALYFLGQCFARRNMHDLAAKTLQTALNEKVGFDEEKKDLIYALGVVFEKMGKAEDAINQYKQIYEVDVGYKDVGKKVDAYYAGSNG
jgi:tetratricopeptide (TPR) repeat protein